jgi:integrase
VSKKNSIWPGVRAKRAKGKLYWYWTRVAPGASWIRLPNPYTDADAFMRKLVHLQRVDARIEERRREGTFGALGNRYLQSTKFKDLATGTQESYRRYINRLLTAYADAPLIELTPEDIQVRVMDANAETPAAADMMLSVLRVLYRFAAKRQRGLEDWTAGIEPYGNRTERQPWPANVLQDALTSKDEPFRLAATLALYTGQRPGDVCAMTWNAAQGGKVRVKQQKTGTPLEIEMHPELAKALASAPRSDRHLFILSNRRGDPLTAGTFLKWCWEFSKAYGLKLGPHGLRKNATNELFDAGCTSAEIAAVTGHKSLAMLEHYGKGRSQPKLAATGMGKWAGTQTEQERENSRAKGKPRP